MKNLKFLSLIVMLLMASICNAQTTMIVTPDGNPVLADTIFKNCDTNHTANNTDTIVITYCHDVKIQVIKHVYDTVASANPWNWTNYSACLWSLPLGTPVWNGTYNWTPSNPDTTYFIAVDSISCSSPIQNGSVYVTFRKNIPNANLLCFATIDTESAHAIIAFDTNGTSGQNIDSVYLYFYNGTWEKIGAKSYNVQDTAEYFVDRVNNPNATPQLRYAVRTVNACGDTSALSNYQQTMYISAVGGTFSWPGTGYQFQNHSDSVLKYYLVRNDSIIDSVAGTYSVIIDPNYNPNAVYWIEAKLSKSTCNLTPIAMGHHMEGGRSIGNVLNATRSNKLKNGMPAGVASVNGEKEITFKAYPNPSHGTFNLDLQKESDVRVYNEIGKMVFQSIMPVGHNQLNLDGQSKGIYFLSVDGVTTKLINE